MPNRYNIGDPDTVLIQKNMCLFYHGSHRAVDDIQMDRFIVRVTERTCKFNMVLAGPSEWSYTSRDIMCCQHQSINPSCL